MTRNFTWEDYKNGLCSADDYMSSEWKSCMYLGMVDYKGHKYFSPKMTKSGFAEILKMGCENAEGISKQTQK